MANMAHRTAATMVDDRPPRVGPAAGSTARTRPDPGLDMTNAVVSGLLVGSASTVLAVFDPQLRHWFILPVTLAGILIGIDAVAWVRRQYDLFHPQAVLGVVGVHFFYLAPILHVLLDYYARHIPYPPEWRDALGNMALLNVAGLFLYRVVVTFRARDGGRAGRGRQISLRTFYRVGLFASLLSVAAFGALLLKFGGVSGYLRVLTAPPEQNGLAGSGWLIIAGEAFPMILFALIAVRWRAPLARRRGLLVLLLLGFVAVQFAVGGLRGSRSNTLWPLMMALIMVHLLIVRISRKALLITLVPVVLFVFLYSFYKSVRLEALDVARGTRTVEQLSSQTGRDVPTMLLGDFARSDIQAMVLEQYLHGSAKPVWGVTYLGDVLSMAPEALVPNPPPTKVDIGSDLRFGEGASEAGWRSSKIYGLSGEAVMNFGPVGGVASFAVLGLCVRWLRRLYTRAREQDSLGLKILVPLLSPYTVLAGDLDNNVWFHLKYSAPLAIVLLFALQHRTASRGPAVAPRPHRHTRPLVGTRG